MLDPYPRSLPSGWMWAFVTITFKKCEVQKKLTKFTSLYMHPCVYRQAHINDVKKLWMFWQNQLIDTLFFSIMALLFNSFDPTIKGFPRIITVKNFVWPKVIPASLWHITSYPRYADQSFHITAHNVYDQQYAPSFPVATVILILNCHSKNFHTPSDHKSWITVDCLL